MSSGSLIAQTTDAALKQHPCYGSLCRTLGAAYGERTTPIRNLAMRAGLWPKSVRGRVHRRAQRPDNLDLMDCRTTQLSRPRTLFCHSLPTARAAFRSYGETLAARLGNCSFRLVRGHPIAPGLWSLMSGSGDGVDVRRGLGRFHREWFEL